MNRHGVTLVELSVALTVTGLALAVGHAGLTSLLDGHDRARVASEETETASAIRRSLVDWLEGARSVREAQEPEFRGLNGYRGRLADDELWLLTTADTPLGTGEFVLHLRIDRDPRTPEAGLVVGVSNWPPGRTLEVEIAPDVAELDIRYWGDLEGTRGWVDSWVATTALPLGIELRLGGADRPLPRLLEHPILVLPRGGEVIVEG